MEHFAEEFDELPAPDGGEFNLETLLTFDLFEDELYRDPLDSQPADRLEEAYRRLLAV